MEKTGGKKGKKRGEEGRGGKKREGEGKGREEAWSWVFFLSNSLVH